MDGTSDELLSRARLAHDENCGIGRSNPGDTRKHGLQSRRCTDNFLERRQLIDFFSQRQIFSVELVFQCLDLVEGFLQFSSSLMLVGHVHNRPDIFNKVTVLVYDRVAHSVNVPYRQVRKNDPIVRFPICSFMDCGIHCLLDKGSVVRMNSFQKRWITRLCLLRIKVIDAKSFLRPEDLS